MRPHAARRTSSGTGCPGSRGKLRDDMTRAYPGWGYSSRSSNFAAALAGSSRRATTSSSSSCTPASSWTCASRRRRSLAAASASNSFIRLRRLRSASVPCSSMNARCSAILPASSSIPSERLASVLTIGTRQPSCGASESVPLISRTIVSVSGWSDLLTTITSGISITPALSAWTESPEPGMRTSTTVSAWPMMSTSAWPTPTVSNITSSLPLASMSSAAWSVASLNPPSEPRLAMERMNTPGSRKWSASRMRSPSRAPLVKGELGSIESTATSRSRPRACSTSFPISVDLPTPGAPVKPTTADLPVLGYTSRTSSQPAGSSFSTSEIARARARLSPFSRRSESSAAVCPGAAIARHPRIAALRAGCTIAAKREWALARVTAASFAEHHPDIPFFVLLADEPQGALDPRAEPFEVVSMQELGAPRRLTGELSRLELTYALTARFVAHVLDRGYDRVLFVKQESLVAGSLDGVFDLLERRSIALTPHLLRPLDPDDELSILLAGVFNGGLVGVADRPQGRQFLDWWRDRAEELCVHDVAAGVHFEQRWLDLVPGFFSEHAIVRDPGCNVGHWNLGEREPPWSLVRFSGFDERDPERVSRYRDLRLGDIGRAAEVWRDYAARLRDAGVTETRDWGYAFDSGGRDRWLRVWGRRPDLRAAFPDPVGDDCEAFGRWVAEHGVHGR